MTTKVMERPPKPTQKRTSSKEVKFKGAFAKNWENCQEKYRAWKPNDRYRFTVKHLKEMEEIAQEDFTKALWVYEQGQSKTRAANEARMPYSLFEYLLEGHQKDEKRKALADRSKLDPMERLELIRDSLLTEVEARLDGDSPKKDFGALAELMGTVKTVTLTLSRLQEGGGNLGKMTQQVISNMPRKEYDHDDDDDDESVH